MRLSVSNIGWTAREDERVYALMRENGYKGLEIAPTRILYDRPYARTKEMRQWAKTLGTAYGFAIPSMQSIWYGRRERLFGTGEERRALLDYTKSAIDLAEGIGCGNLVFGCPGNRALSEGADASVAVGFFKELGDYAAAHGAAIGMEANPPVYGTDYINDTLSALGLIGEVASEGFRLNLDIGAMIQNGEDIEMLVGAVHLISHVHISEPGLKPIQKRRIHGKLRDLLERGGYQGFVSVEMGRTDDPADIERAIRYVREVFL